MKKKKKKKNYQDASHSGELHSSIKGKWTSIIKKNCCSYKQKNYKFK